MINYHKIAEAVDHYKTLGYELIDVPWLVSTDSMLVTRPKGARLFTTFAGDLVASGEQSFIEIRKKLMKFQKYQCVTPCFRDDKLDNIHQQYFLKNELIYVVDSIADKAFLNIVINDAMKFFSKWGGNPKIIETTALNAFHNKDIFINGIEVGSYGIRTYDGFTWVYGTGCAEPRYTMAREHKPDLLPDEDFFDKLREIEICNQSKVEMPKKQPEKKFEFSSNQKKVVIDYISSFSAKAFFEDCDEMWQEEEFDEEKYDAYCEALYSFIDKVKKNAIDHLT